ncbi:MAG: NCS2 family permease [Planctomycetota bacterium]
MQAIRRFFGIDAAGSTIGTEVRAGVVTFMTMAYIIVVQPLILSGAGMPPGGVMLATCLASAFATLVMGLFANYPIALAPAMGHNIYFVGLVVGGVVPNWQTALGAVFVSGAAFIVLSFFGFRERIVHAVPDSLKYAIATGIGLLIAVVGLRSAGIVVENATATGWTLGPFGWPVVLALIGLAITGSLMAFRVKGAILIGLIATAVVGAVMGLVTAPPSPVGPPPWDELGETLFGLDVLGALKFGFFGVIFTFFFLDLFDTVGTLIGVCQQAGLMREGELPRARRALFADASGTVLGAVLGTSTVTSYVESAAGVSEGGKTGLASVVTAALFLVAIFFYPSVQMITGGTAVDKRFEFQRVEATVVEEADEEEAEVARPVALPEGATLRVRRSQTLSPVTAPTLIIIGCLIMTSVVHIPWGDWTEALPAFLAILLMPLTFSITDGIAFGFIAYAFLKLVTGRWREVSPWVAVFAVLFLLRYIFLA